MGLLWLLWLSAYVITDNLNRNFNDFKGLKNELIENKEVHKTDNWGTLSYTL